MKTIRDVTFDLLRAFDMTTIFGNVGSTEETFLKNFPSDFRYILGLQEASVVGMADGFAQSTRRPALVNVHTGAGLGNAMGALLTAFQNKTPLIITWCPGMGRPGLRTSAVSRGSSALCGRPAFCNGPSLPKT